MICCYIVKGIHLPLSPEPQLCVSQPFSFPIVLLSQCSCWTGPASLWFSPFSLGSGIRNLGQMVLLLLCLHLSLACVCLLLHLHCCFFPMSPCTTAVGLTHFIPVHPLSSHSSQISDPLAFIHSCQHFEIFLQVFF